MNVDDSAPHGRGALRWINRRELPDVAHLDIDCEELMELARQQTVEEIFEDLDRLMSEDQNDDQEEA